MTDAVNPTLIPTHGVAFPDETDTATFDARASALFKYFVGNFFSGANVLADQAYTNALAAQESAGIAAAIANYKGPWSGLTGALAIPAAVSHSGKLWLLLSSVADVTTKVPGVATEWFDVTPMNRDGGAFLGNVDLPSLNGGALSGHRNRLINGDMRVVQYSGAGSIAAGAAVVHVLDGWRISNASDAVLTASLVPETLSNGQRVNWLSCAVTTADASIGASQYCFVKTYIEGYDIEDLVGRTFTVSGVVQSSVAGVHSVNLRNSGIDRFFNAEINIAAPNVPQDFSFTVVGGLPSAGTWNFTTGAGIGLGFVLAAGSSNTGAAGSWQTGSASASASQVNALATVGNVFRIADVQVECGPIKTPFSRPPYALALARCQRYYERADVLMGYGADTLYAPGFWKVRKRIAPTITLEHGIGPFSAATATFSALNAGTSVDGFYQFNNSTIGTVGATANKIVVGDARF